MPCLNKRLHSKIDNRNYLILSSNLKTYLFTYILYMKQNSGFVELHNGPPGVKNLSPKNSYTLWAWPKRPTDAPDGSMIMVGTDRVGSARFSLSVSDMVPKHVTD